MLKNLLSRYPIYKCILKPYILLSLLFENRVNLNINYTFTVLEIVLQIINILILSPHTCSALLVSNSQQNCKHISVNLIKLPTSPNVIIFQQLALFYVIRYAKDMSGIFIITSLIKTWICHSQQDKLYPTQ